MLEAMISKLPGYATIKNTPILTINHLKKNIRVEMEIFKQYLHTELIPLLQKSRGRPFAMIVHDAVTLPNKTKYYSIGIQFTDQSFDCNHVVALSFGK